MADKFHSELSAEQFKILKTMCENQAYIIIAPHNAPGDTEEVRIGHTKHTTMLFDLVKQNFLENVTHEFDEILSKAREQNKRMFDAFVITQQTITMFTPKEGSIN